MEDFTPYFISLTEQQRKYAIEALIFASDDVLTLNHLIEILFEKERYLRLIDKTNNENTKLNSSEFAKIIFDKFEINDTYILETINEINQELYQTNRTFHIVEYGGGFQFTTRSEHGEFVSNLYKSRLRKRLSQASLETLAIISYKQPVSKAGVELIRGVNSKEIVNSLQDKGFVKVVGRSEALGKPLLYGTTNEFLKVFGLKNLNELPKLRELEEIAELLKEEESENDVLIKVDYELSENEDAKIDDEIKVDDSSDDNKISESE